MFSLQSRHYIVALIFLFICRNVDLFRGSKGTKNIDLSEFHAKPSPSWSLGVWQSARGFSMSLQRVETRGGRVWLAGAAVLCHGRPGRCLHAGKDVARGGREAGGIVRGTLIVRGGWVGREYVLCVEVQGVSAFNLLRPLSDGHKS